MDFFFCFHQLRDNYKPQFTLQQWIGGLILEQEAEKKLFWMSSMLESHLWNLFYKEAKSWDSTTRFRIWQFQTLALKQYLQMHLVAKRVILGNDYRGFLKEWVKIFLMSPRSPL